MMRGPFIRFTAFLFVIACMWDPALAADTRRTNSLERAYIDFALDIEDHRVCRKISPRALGYTESGLKGGDWHDLYGGFQRRNDGSMQRR